MKGSRIKTSYAPFSRAWEKNLNILPYPKLPASLEAYDDRSPIVAAFILHNLSTSVPALEGEHVGSTSIPGCPGKGVIDLMLLYHSQDELSAINGALFSARFQRQKTRDPFPDDRPMRVGLLEHDGRKWRIHVHVIPHISQEVHELKFFRDTLIADPDLRSQYVEIKRQILDSGVTDSVDYAERKADFIQSVITRTHARENTASPGA